jgi:hypothetical protein
MLFRHTRFQQQLTRFKIDYATFCVHNHSREHTMQAVEVFSARDLRNRSGELIKHAEQGHMTVITKHGKLSMLAIPFDVTSNSGVG